VAFNLKTAKALGLDLSPGVLAGPGRLADVRYRVCGVEFLDPTTKDAPGHASPAQFDGQGDHHLGRRRLKSQPSSRTWPQPMRKSRNAGGFYADRRKPDLRRTAWWSWQDSNLQPNDYVAP
jgi:hypothetical protein